VQLINAVDLFQKMRKSLGNKRNELGKEHIATIAKTFGDFRASKISKIFDNADFGYRRITIERPLRLAFEVTPERLDAAEGREGLPEGEQGGPRDALLGLRSRSSRCGQEGQALHEPRGLRRGARRGSARPAPQGGARPDERARRELRRCARTRRATWSPTPSCADYENVPLKEDIAAYFEREVKPHVPDAWIAGVEIKSGKASVRDETKVKVGYEIPITRHFYEYKPLRPLAEIEAEIKSLEKEIQTLLG
jgi:type I restriction enzyme M protein